MKKQLYILLLALALPFVAGAQWTKGGAGVLTYHCAGCTGIADLVLTADSIGMQGTLRADIALCDSLGRAFEQWNSVTLCSKEDSAVAARLHRFVSRRQGYIEMLVYRPTAWDPRMTETFSYIVPTLKTERKQ